MLGCLLVQTGLWGRGEARAASAGLSRPAPGHRCTHPLLPFRLAAGDTVPGTEGFLEAGTQHKAGRISLTRSWGCIWPSLGIPTNTPRGADAEIWVDPGGEGALGVTTSPRTLSKFGETERREVCKGLSSLPS